MKKGNMTYDNTHLILGRFWSSVVGGGAKLGFGGGIGVNGGRGGIRVPPALGVNVIDFTDCDITLEHTKSENRGEKEGEW